MEPLLSAIAELWARPEYHDLRLGQLIQMVIAPLNVDADLFYMEDDVLRRLVEKQMGRKK